MIITIHGKTTKMVCDPSERPGSAIQRLTLVKDLGCPEPTRVDHYSYSVSWKRKWAGQTCVGFSSRLSKRAAKRYVHVKHYTKDGNCHNTNKVICERYHGNQIYTFTEHCIGGCPLCDYKEGIENDQI